MFESEDFDLDEDFLKDIGEKEHEYYSQNHQPETTRLTKRRKTDTIQPDISCDISFNDEPDFTRITLKSAKAADETGPRSNSPPCDNVVPAIAKSTPVPKCRDEREIVCVFGRSEMKQGKWESNENVKTSRRTLALEVLRKGSRRGKEETGKNDDAKGSRPLSLFNSERYSCDHDSDKQARRRTFLESFKKPAAGAARILNSAQKTRFSGRDNRPSSARVTTVVRKFPGPAGLLPDSPDPHLEDANFLERVNENITETTEVEKEDEISEYFSQNTERLFRSGGWRLMLDDLPSNFLRGHEIAMIKRTACNNSKIPLLAGVVQRIDHSLENPRLVLKDLTDQIEGTMHRDIPLAHPNVLEPGVVVLLRNVGILAFQTSPSFPSLQFHVMIAPRNVAAVYSDKTRLLSSPWMDSILGNSLSEPDQTRLLSENSSVRFTRRAEDNKSAERSSTIAVRVHRGSDTHGNKDYAKIDPSDDDEETFSRFNLDDRETSLSSANCFINEKNIESHGSSTNEEGERQTGAVGAIIETGTSIERSKLIDLKENTNQVVLRPKKIASVRLRLAQFRSKDDLESRGSTDEKDISKQKEDLLESMDNSSGNGGDSKWTDFGDNLLDSDNDTEDELLSQLDVDSIVSSYATS